MSDNKAVVFQKVTSDKPEVAKEFKKIKVEAILPGWYDLRRIAVGTVFEVPENMVSKVWMKKITE